MDFKSGENRYLKTRMKLFRKRLFANTVDESIEWVERLYMVERVQLSILETISTCEIEKYIWKAILTKLIVGKKIKFLKNGPS